LQKVTEARNVADDRLKEKTAALALSTLRLAQAEWEQAHVLRARDLLDEVSAENRGWGWGDLRRQFQGGHITRTGHTGGGLGGGVGAGGGRAGPRPLMTGRRGCGTPAAARSCTPSRSTVRAPPKSALGTPAAARSCSPSRGTRTVWKACASARTGTN